MYFNFSLINKFVKVHIINLNLDDLIVYNDGSLHINFSSGLE